MNRKKIFCLAAGALALAAGCSRIDHSAVLATPVADEMVAWLKDQQTADVKEVLDQIAGAEASREQLVQASADAEAEESRSAAESIEEASRLEESVQESVMDYLLAQCEGTNLTPYGVAAIDDTDAPLVHKLFENTVVIGDSRVEGVEWVLSESEVFFSRGGYAGNLHELARRAAGMYPDKALFWIGLNDMSVYEEKTDRFVKDYEELIRDFLSVNPGCEIYIHNQPAVPQEGLDHFEFAKYIDDYNDAMKEMCDENGWTYVDGSAYLRPEYFAEDGLHFQKKFYRYWVQDMANQLDLWGDLAQ